jgi:phosphoribosylamine--glycine ligase
VRVLCIDHAGFMLDFVLRAVEDGHEVKWFIRQTEKTKCIGRGLATIVDEWQGWMRWADLVMLPDNTKYVREVDAWRKNHGSKVVGATQEAAAWELDRKLGQDILKKHGIPVPPYKEFAHYDEAIAHVKKQNRRFVSKPCGDEEDKSLSYVAKSPADMVYMLERWKKAKRHKGSFILQDFIGGVEMAVGAWFGPHGFNEGWCENFEFKKLFPGEKGPATGEMGTALQIVRQSKLARKVLKPLEEALHGIGYCGYVDVNCIIDDAGTPWPLEFTMRPGWPTFNIQQALVKGDTVEWLAALSDGQDVKPFSFNSVSLGVVMAIPDFPYSHLTRKEVLGVPIYEMKPSIRSQIHPCELMQGSAPHNVNGKVVDMPCMVSAGDYLLVASGTGATVTLAKQKAYKALETLEVPNSPFWRQDIGDRLKKQLPILQSKGFATDWVF